MDWTALIKTIALCLVSILIEALSATKDGRVWFQQLKRPKYSFSLQVWYLVGAIYYIIFGLIAYRQFAKSLDIFSMPIILLALVMILNGLGNFIIFKYRSLKWFYLVIYPFGVLLLILILVLLPNDKISALMASLYFIWLIYDLYYGYHMWKLNS
jgi:tryptophan-rich sensory protein